MTTLNRKDILAISDIRIEVVDVSEWWGGTVCVRGLTGAERDRFEASIVQTTTKDQKVNMVNIRAKLCVLSICDEDGKRLFTDGEVKVMAEKSAAALQRIFIVAQRLSGIGEDAVKELAEGLKTDPLEGFASDSLDTLDSLLPNSLNESPAPN
jgi:hypothetical protein